MSMSSSSSHLASSSRMLTSFRSNLLSASKPITLYGLNMESKTSPSRGFHIFTPKLIRKTLAKHE